MGRTYVPGRGKEQPSPASCSRYSRYAPRPKCKGLAIWDLPNAAAVPFLLGTSFTDCQPKGSASCLGKP